MVRADELHVEAAKAYVSELQAKGGTNINAALLAGVEQLRRQALSDVEPRPSVIVFLTDGQPSSGEASTTQIMRNLAQANSNGYSLLALGFGNDVDFRFLTQLAQQHDGVARRIYTDADVALQLENFYAEVSTPLMSDVKVRYLDNSVNVDSVTKTDYSNLFNGTEIIIAGKLKDNSVNNVIAQVSGQSSTGYMEMNVRTNIARAENKLRNLDLTHLTERLWAYLSIKKLLDTARESHDEALQQSAKAKILQLSLKHSFVTPLTSMVVTKPEVSDEEEDDSVDTSSQDHAISKQSGRRNRGRAFVDNDPHFVVDVAGIDDRLCFDVNGSPGDVFQLLYDKENDLIVNAQVQSPAVVQQGTNHVPTYISKIAIMHSSKTVVFSARRFVVQNMSFQWKSNNNVTIQDLRISFVSNRKAHVEIGRNIKFVIIRHLAHVPSPTKVEFLGFYIETGDGLSEFCHGLLGQFQKTTATFIGQPQEYHHTSKIIRTLELSNSFSDSHTVTVYQRKRRNMHLNQHIPCWHVNNNGQGLLQGNVNQYLLPKLTSRQYSINLKREFR